jgi:hypothetical protein
MPRMAPYLSIACAVYSEHDGRNRHIGGRRREVRWYRRISATHTLRTARSPRGRRSQVIARVRACPAPRPSSPRSRHRSALASRRSPPGIRALPAAAGHSRLREAGASHGYAARRRPIYDSRKNPRAANRPAWGPREARAADAHRTGLADTLDESHAHCTTADLLEAPLAPLSTLRRGRHSDGQSMPSTRPTRLQHTASIFGAHALSKAVNPLVATVLRLVSSLHVTNPSQSKQAIIAQAAPRTSGPPSVVHTHHTTAATVWCHADPRGFTATTRG